MGVRGDILPIGGADAMLSSVFMGLYLLLLKV